MLIEASSYKRWGFIGFFIGVMMRCSPYTVTGLIFSNLTIGYPIQLVIGNPKIPVGD
jgi:hypothetical protein